MRGTLPIAEELTVGDALSGWVEAEAVGACDRTRGDELAGIITDFNARWADWLAEHFPRQR